MTTEQTQGRRPVASLASYTHYRDMSHDTDDSLGRGNEHSQSDDGSGLTPRGLPPASPSERLSLTKEREWLSADLNHANVSGSERLPSGSNPRESTRFPLPSISRRVDTVAQQADIAGRVYPHCLRATATSYHAHQRGGPMPLQALIDRSGLATTQRVHIPGSTTDNPLT